MGTSNVYLDRSIVGVGDRDQLVELDSDRAAKLVKQGLATRAQQVHPDSSVQLSDHSDAEIHDEPRPPAEPVETTARKPRQSAARGRRSSS